MTNSNCKYVTFVCTKFTETSGTSVLDELTVSGLDVHHHEMLVMERIKHSSRDNKLNSSTQLISSGIENGG